MIFESKKNELLKKSLIGFFAICFVISRAIRLFFIEEDESGSGLVLSILIFAACMLVFLIVAVALLNEKIILRETELKISKGLVSRIISYERIRNFVYANQNEIILQTENGDVVIDVTNFDSKDEILKGLSERISICR